MHNFKTLAQPLLGEFGWGSSCSCCYHRKTKSTPRFGLGWEFDNNKKCKRSNQAFLISHKLFVFENKLLINIKEGKMSVNIFSFALDLF